MPNQSIWRVIGENFVKIRVGPSGILHGWLPDFLRHGSLILKNYNQTILIIYATQKVMINKELFSEV